MWEHVTIAEAGSSCFFYAVLVVVLIVMGYLRVKIEQVGSEQRKAGPKRPVQRGVPQSQIEESGRRLPPRPPAPGRPPQPQRQAPRPPVVWEAPAPPPRRPEQPRPVARPQPAPQRSSPPTPRPPQERRVVAAAISDQREPAAKDFTQIASKPSPVVAPPEPKTLAAPAVRESEVQPSTSVEAKRPFVQLVGLPLIELQRAFVFSEILAPPLALREEQKLF